MLTGWGIIHGRIYIDMEIFVLEIEPFHTHLIVKIAIIFFVYCFLKAVKKYITIKI